MPKPLTTARYRKLMVAPSPIRAGSTLACCNAIWARAPARSAGGRSATDGASSTTIADSVSAGGGSCGAR